jgi:hypothetical protein
VSVTWYQLLPDHSCVPCTGKHGGPAPGETSWARVAETYAGALRVSTVFLGLDHNFDKIGPPVVFETMIFSRSEWSEEYCERYSSWDAAVAGHRRAVFWAYTHVWIQIRSLWNLLRKRFVR